MSLVALKNHLLPRGGYRTLSQNAPEDQSRENGSDGSVSSADIHDELSYQTLETADLESQLTRASTASSRPSKSGGPEKRKTDMARTSKRPSPSSGGGGDFRLTARLISDATIGLSDGLTVPFALTAGLSALGETKVVVFGGLAELIAGAISMGLGGYLGAKAEADAYRETRRRVAARFAPPPHESAAVVDEDGERCAEERDRAAAQAVREVFDGYDVPADTLDALARHLVAAAPSAAAATTEGGEDGRRRTTSTSSSPAATPGATSATTTPTSSSRLVDFLMQFHECASPPAASRALSSALTIALGYLIGGLIPLSPYFFVGSGPGSVNLALFISVGVMVVALFAFGYGKTCAVTGRWFARGKEGWEAVWGGLQMVLVGGAAAGAAMALVRAFDSFVH